MAQGVRGEREAGDAAGRGGREGRRRPLLGAPLPRRRPRGQAQPPQPAPAVHDEQAAAGGLAPLPLPGGPHDAPRAGALRRKGPRRSRHGRPDHLHAYRLDARCRRGARRGARAHRQDVRRRLPAGVAALLPPEQVGAGRARSDPPDEPRPLARAGPPAPRGGRVQPLQARLGPLRRQPDVGRGVRRDDGRRRRGRGALPRRRAGAAVRRLARRLSGDARGGRRGRGRGRRFAAGARGGGDARPRRAAAAAELHPAAAALHRGDARPRARRERHRPALHLRRDPRRPVREGLHGQGRGAAQADGARRAGRRPAREALRRHLRRRVHRADGRGAGQGRGRRDGRRASALRLLLPLPQGPRPRAHADGEHQAARREDRRQVRAVRRDDGQALGPLRRVPRLREVPRVQEHQGAQRRPPAAPRDRRDVPELRQADGAAPREVGPVPRLLRLSGVQDDPQDQAPGGQGRGEEGSRPRREVPGVRQAAGAQERALRRVRRLHRLPRLPLHAPGGDRRRLPQVRQVGRRPALEARQALLRLHRLPQL